MHVKRKSSNAQVNKKWGLFGPTSTFMVAIRERRVLVGIIQTKTVSRGSRYQAKSQFELQLFVKLHTTTSVQQMLPRATCFQGPQPSMTERG